MTRTDIDKHPDPFAEFINHDLYWGDEVFIPIEPPAPTDPRWHYVRYQAASPVRLYSQPDTHFAYNVALRPTRGYAHAMMRGLPDVRPGWSAVTLMMGEPVTAYVRNASVSFRRSTGIYEYFLMFVIFVLIILGLSAQILLYALSRRKTDSPDTISLAQRVETFVTRLEMALYPIQ